jgi:TonB-linked SusC/RagA family outer membrane protein
MYNRINRILLALTFVGGLVQLNSLHASNTQSDSFGETVVAATITVSGEVKDEDGQPLIGCHVKIKDSSKGTITDGDGYYSLQTEEEDILVFSYLGFKTEYIHVKGRRNIDVKLYYDYSELDEVVVVAYGVQSKRTLTAAVGSLKQENVRNIPANSVDQLLQGRVSGVSIITPTAGVSDAPVVRIRGVSSISSGTSPLYVLDGIAIDNTNAAGIGRTNPLADINPQDIFSIDVLKDAAAAALYGSRAANGVILITTKQGEKGKVKVGWDSYYGVSARYNAIKGINAKQYVDIKNLSVKNRYGTDQWDIANNRALTDGRQSFNLWYKNDGTYYDTNWENEVYRTGIQRSHTVSLSSGTDRSRFYLSGNYADQDGIVKGDNYNRFGMNTNGTFDATRYLKIGGSINASISKTKVSDGSRIQFGSASSDGFSRLAIVLPANMPARDENGIPYIGEGGYMGTYPNTVLNNWPNPVAHLYYGTNSTINIIRTIGNVYGELHPFSGFALKTQFGIDYGHTDDSFFLVSQVSGDKQNGEVKNNSTSRIRKTWTNTATYLYSIGSHNIDVLLGEETVEGSLYRWGAQRDVLLDTKFKGYNGSWSQTIATAGAETENALASFFARVNYDYDSKYLLSLNLRRDGYSALSRNNRWGTFGGTSAAWRLSEENFWEPLRDLVSEFKVKGSWGIVGNTSIDDYAAWSYYTTNYYGGEGGYTLSQIADSENLKWESSNKVNIGFASVLFNNISIDFDLYRNRSTNLLLSVPTTYSKGIPGNAITTNAGSMENRGMELNIGAALVRKKKFSWNTSFNITTGKNEVTSLANGVTQLASGSYNITKVGYSIGQLYLYPTKGVDVETGRRIFLDKAGRETLYYYEKSDKWIYKDDGSVASESNIVKEISGNTQPTYYGGWNNDIKYRNFDLSLFFQFSGGNKIYNANKAMESNYSFWSNSKDVYDNYWTPERTNARFSIPIYGDNYSNGYSAGISQWVENGDYLRLKNAVLGYSFDTKKWQLGISNLRVYVQAQNLLTITDYSGPDPEANVNSTSSTNANLQGGIDRHSAPHARTFTFGINLSL